MTPAEIEASLDYADSNAERRMAKALIAIDHYAEVLQAEGHKYTKIGDDIRRIIEEA